jgi:hypothetical protein
MKDLMFTLEIMARMALFTAVMAMSLRYLGQRRPQPVRTKRPADRAAA